MNNIPKKKRAEMAANPFYSRCCISGEEGTRRDPIEWHHNLVYGGKQVQEIFAILPLRRSLHKQANNKQLRAQLDWVMLNRATPEEIQKYSKAIDYGMYLMTLNCIYGAWSTVPLSITEFGGEVIKY